MSDEINTEINTENSIYELKPDINGISDEDTIKFSYNAIEEIKKIINENQIGEEFSLRIGLRGGGIDGTEFFLEFDSEIQKNDRKYILEGIPLILDSRSLFFLLGYLIDFNKNGFILSEK